MQMVDEHTRKQIDEVVSYLKEKAGMPLSMKDLLALVYLADRHSLRCVGRPIIGGNEFPRTCSYVIVDESLPPINVLVAKRFGLHPGSREQFLMEMDLMA